MGQMTDHDLSPDDCLRGARLCFDNARSIHLASIQLRRRGRNREAVLLLATAVEEAAKAGMLHSAWQMRDSAETYDRLMATWSKMKWSHTAKHNAAEFTGSRFLMPFVGMGLALALLSHRRVGLVSKETAGSALVRAVDALLGSPDPPPIPGWYQRLHQERQAIFVDWGDNGWTEPDVEAAGRFFDEGRRGVRDLFANLRRDLRRPRLRS